MKARYINMVALMLSMGIGMEVHAQDDVATTPYRDVFSNPAMKSYQTRISQTEVSVGYDYRQASTPVRLEQGTGHSRAFADVDAFLRKGMTTLWGEASYSKGSTRNIQFCETSDFELLYPYLMADTVGGKSQQERYHFLGGFSYPVGRWNVAAEGAYTALMEYRTRDPRPKNLSGDLKASIAASYRLGNPQDGYVLGLSLDARKYKQTNEVKLYNEVSVPTIYHLTGLGYDYYRFRGMNTSTYYNGYGVGGKLDWARVNQRGWFAHLEYGYLDIDKIISSLNELPMANIKEYREKVTVGYSVGCERNTWGYNLSEQWTRRRGRENIFGTAQDNVYPQISTAAPYVSDKACFSTEVNYRHVFPNKSEIGIMGNLRWDSWEEWYEVGSNVTYDDEEGGVIVRDLEGNDWAFGLHLSGKVNLRHWQLKAELSGEYQMSTTGSPDNFYISDRDEVNSVLLKPVELYFDYLNSDRQLVDATVEAGYTKDRRFSPFVRVGWQYAHYMETEHQNRLVVAMGVRF